jgi:hypothetical protein
MASLTPERIAEVIRLWAPLAIGIGLCLYGLIASNLGWVAAGCSTLGIPLVISTDK